MRLVIIALLVIVLSAAALPAVEAQSPQYYVVQVPFNWSVTSSFASAGRVWSDPVLVDQGNIHAIITTGTGSAQASGAQWNSNHGNGNIYPTATIAHCYRYLGVTPAACDAAGVSWTTTSASTTISPPATTTLRYEIVPPGWPASATATLNITTVYVVLYGIPPFQASFTATPNTGPAPLTVQFTDTSNAPGANYWEWNFGDGTGQTSAQSSSPVHVYTERGIYIVTLTVSDGTRSSTYSMNINVGTPEEPPSACLNLDQQFQRSDRWNTVGQVQFTTGGVVLYPASRITAAASLYLDSASSYNVTFFAQSLVSYAGAVRLNLGNEVFNFTIHAGSGAAIFQAPANNPQPDQALFHSLSMTNTGTAPVLVTSLCVDDFTRSLKPGRCLFKNPTFDGQPATTSWQTTGGVTTGEAPGYIKMADGAAISQRVKMYPNGPQNPHQYMLYAHVTVGPGPRSLYQNNFTDTIALEYEFPQGAGFQAIQSPAGSNAALVGSLFPQYPDPTSASFLPSGYVVFRTFVVISDVTDDLFTIRASSSNPDIQVYVDEVCVDDTFAHHEDYPWLPIWDFDPQCSYIAIPTTNDVGAWTYWHWQNLDKFFRCDLMKLLNRMFNTIWAGYRLMQWQVLYFQSFLIQTNDWISSSLFPWLNGHFRNIAVGQVTIVEGGSGAGFWDVLLAIVNLIRPVLDLIVSALAAATSLLLNVVTGAIGFVIALASQGLSIIQQATGLLGALISAYNNAPPRTLPGLPSCSSNPQGHPLCIAWWVLDNTIFSGPGALVIPVLTGILSIHLILWVVGELKRALMQAGTAS